jgi:glutamine amidotransferase
VSAGPDGGPALAILDYGMGNLRSVAKAVERVGGRPQVTSDHRSVRAADAVVLPGVGAFPRAMEAVRELELDALVRERAAEGIPTLGICLGMQLLFEWSAEHGGAEGMGLVEGAVEAIPSDGLKLPQIGWNPVAWRRPSRLVEDLPDPCAFYHVHSFAPVPARADDVLGTAVYGSEFVSAIERHPLYGVQFHPEKSGAHGLGILAGFVAICRGRRPAGGAA